MHRRTIAPGLPSTLIELPGMGKRVLRLCSTPLTAGRRFWFRLRATLFTRRILSRIPPPKFRRIFNGRPPEFMFQFTKYIPNGRGIECLPVSKRASSFWGAGKRNSALLAQGCLPRASSAARRRLGEFSGQSGSVYFQFLLIT